MVTTSTQWWEIGLFTTIDEGWHQPDLMMHYGSVPFDMNTLRRGLPDDRQRLLPDAQRDPGPVRGTVRLRTRDFRDRPRVDPRYFTDPEGHDERIMLTGVRLARTIAEQYPLRHWVARELAPGPDATHRRRTARLHPQVPQHRLPPGRDRADGRVSTTRWRCSIRELRVKGVQRLRVVDASAMPKLPAVNPNITVMTMAEKCADLIRRSLISRTASVLTSHRSWASTRRSRRCPDDELAATGGRIDASQTSRAGAVVADYATRVPDEVWMVRSGQVTLHASADAHHDRHRRAGGIFGYTPLLTGGGMEFVARSHVAEHADPAAGCAGPLAVRQAGGPGVPGVRGVERHAAPGARDRADRPHRTRRSGTSSTATCSSSDRPSVRDAVVR